MTLISNSNDMIDIRDVIARIEELRDEIAAAEISEENGAEPQFDDDCKTREEIATCGTCGKSWNDALITGSTPAPSGRCPYESSHDEIEELKALESLANDCQGYGGDHQWEGSWYPVTLIRDSYFQEYAEELAGDIGAIDPKAAWPANCIDWEEAASQLQMDYMAVEFGGVKYWARS